MVRDIFMHKGITLPVRVKEGKISLVESVTVNGDKIVPTLANPVKQGDAVALIGDLLVEKATGSNGVIIGYVHDHPEFDNDPRIEYTATEAVNTGMLRKCGVETIYNDIRTVDAKKSEAITAGDYLEFSTDGYKKVQSGESNVIALTNQDNNDRIVVAIK